MDADEVKGCNKEASTTQEGQKQSAQENSIEKQNGKTEGKGNSVANKSESKPRRRNRIREDFKFPVEPTIIQVVKKPRAYMNHSYRDFSRVPAETGDNFPEEIQNMTFPQKVHHILSQEEYAKYISWMAHGRSMRVHSPALFEKEVSHKYFGHTRYSSFLRQLANYGFKHITAGADRNCYYHEFMLRGLPHLCKYMPRPKDARRLIPDPENEPNFYKISEAHPLPDDNLGDKEKETIGSLDQPASVGSVATSVARTTQSTEAPVTTLLCSNPTVPQNLLAEMASAWVEKQLQNTNRSHDSILNFAPANLALASNSVPANSAVAAPNQMLTVNLVAAAPNQMATVTPVAENQISSVNPSSNTQLPLGKMMQTAQNQPQAATLVQTTQSQLPAANFVPTAQGQTPVSNILPTNQTPGTAVHLVAPTAQQCLPGMNAPPGQTAVNANTLNVGQHAMNPNLVSNLAAVAALLQSGSLNGNPQQNTLNSFNGNPQQNALNSFNGNP